jgi:XTP/dITP diphosphohydrolase
VAAPPPPEAGRIVLVVTSPRVAAGLLGWSAWQALRGAAVVFAADPDPVWVSALGEAGVSITDLAAEPVAVRAGRLVEAARPGTEVVWFGSADGDPGLTDALAEHLARQAIAGAPPEVELVGGSHDLPGARLLDLVAVMDRLRSPGGCPWDARQSHASLAPYLLEEAHEVLELLDRPAEELDREALREELGDLLLQVVFHARLAEDDDAFDIDGVAAGIVAKLVRRHPHVFGDVTVSGAGEVAHNWEQLKAAEKQRTGPFEGIPAGLPALARAQKMLDRLDTATDDDLAGLAGDDPVAAALLAAVQRSRAAGIDAEAALRSALGRLADQHRG